MPLGRPEFRNLGLERPILGGERLALRRLGLLVRGLPLLVGAGVGGLACVGELLELGHRGLVGAILLHVADHVRVDQRGVRLRGEVGLHDVGGEVEDRSELLAVVRDGGALCLEGLALGRHLLGLARVIGLAEVAVLHFLEGYRLPVDDDGLRSLGGGLGLLGFGRRLLLGRLGGQIALRLFLGGSLFCGGLFATLGVLLSGVLEQLERVVGNKVRGCGHVEFTSLGRGRGVGIAHRSTFRGGWPRPQAKEGPGRSLSAALVTMDSTCRRTALTA